MHAGGRRSSGRGRAARTRRVADMDLRLRAGARGRGAAACLHAGAGGGCSARGSMARGAACARGRARAAASVRLGAASARSSPVPAVRRAGVSERAPGGGGEPRAARPRADAARSRSAPAPAPRARARSRRARSLYARPAPPAPRLRPVFLWARQRDGAVLEVRCEDYDARNRLRLARTPLGWRAIPRTPIYDAIRVPHAPPARRRRRAPPAAWLAPDLESHIPSHTIAVPRAPPAPPPDPPEPAPPEPTPLDNLLAVAELEFNQQRGEELELELQAGGAPYAFLPEEAVARDVMSFELTDGKPAEELFYERKETEDAFATEKDLFESISEAHYLPELSGPHDEALLESLVEKGCEDNQILGQALDKLASLVSAGEYEEEEAMLLAGAPVHDIIHRLETELESPSRSSITAAQGLLHLHIGDHLPHYLPDHLDYYPEPDQPDKQPDELPQPEPAENMYTETVPDLHDTYDDKDFEDNSQSSQAVIEPPEVPLPNETTDDDGCEKMCDDVLPKLDTDNIVATDSADQHVDQQNVMEESEVTDTNIDLMKELEETCVKMEEVADMPTNLSTKVVEIESDEPPMDPEPAPATEPSPVAEEALSDKHDEQPKDLSIHRRLPTPHASPRRIEIPRAPSRESDAMQSPQPSGIPAISSPEVFNAPMPKGKQPSFLESLYASTSPKMYTSEVTITKQQCEPLNLGKHRKSASPTVSSCSDEIRKPSKDYGEPQEKRIKRDSLDDLTKITKMLNKCSEEKVSESKQKKSDKPIPKPSELERLPSPLQQLEDLKSNKNFNIPDPLLVPKDKLNDILVAPGIEIPALLMQRPELRLPEIFEHPNMMRDPDILVISLSQLENIMGNDNKHNLTSPKPKESRPVTKTTSTEKPSTPIASTTQPDQTSQPKPIPSMGALADDIDAATSAALNQMLWLPYLSQLEAMAACSQNMDFLKALNSTGYNGANYAELSQMFNHQSRFMNLQQGSFPMMPPMDYDSRMQFAMWQEAMNHASTATSQRKSQATMEAQMKEMAAKSANEFQSPYVHSTKSQSKTHSAARTSPITNNFANQRSMPHPNPFLQGMYPGMNPNVRPNVPLPGLQIPYFNPNLMGSQRSPRTSQQKSPTSPYFPNNNYLQSVKHSEGHQRSASTSSQESPRPRISVKSLQELQQTAAGGRRASGPGPGPARRRDEPEVGSTTPLGEPHLPPHPHDPAAFHLWHPLFGNQKGYTSPWSWTTVTATGD